MRGGVRAMYAKSVGACDGMYKTAFEYSATGHNNTIF